MRSRNVGLLLFVDEPVPVLAPVKLGLDVVDPLRLELVVVLVPVKHALDLRKFFWVLLWHPPGVPVLDIRRTWQRDPQAVDLVDRTNGAVL